MAGSGNFFYNAVLLAREALFMGLHAWWWKMRLAAFLMYLKEPPHRVVLRTRDSLAAAEEDLIYGETPPLTTARILEKVQARPGDVFYDLGCGRGLAVLTAAGAYKVASVGADLVPDFIERARKIKKFSGLAGAEFINSDFRKLDLSRASIVYAASTTFSEETMTALAEKLKELGEGARVITLSAPIRAPHLSLTGSCVLNFTWGKTHAYFHVRT